MLASNTTPPPSSNRTCGFPASGSPVSIHRRDCAIQLESQRRIVLGQLDFQCPRLRRGICIQAAFPSSYSSTFTVRPLRSTIVTRFLATMGLSDSRSRPPCGYAFPHCVGGSPTARPGLPGSSADLSTRAVLLHPGKPDECTHPLLLHRWQASASLTHWPLALGLTRLIQVRLRYGSRVRLPRPRATDCSVTRLVGYLLNG